MLEELKETAAVTLEFSGGRQFSSQPKLYTQNYVDVCVCCVCVCIFFHDPLLY